MDKELKDKWIAKLRNPETKQVQGTLKTENGYCCLGVLASIIGQDEELLKELKSSVAEDDYRLRVRVEEDWHTGILPLSWVRKFKWPSQTAERLIGKNDSGSSFVEIADWIEETL